MCSKFHSASLFTLFQCIQVIPFCISISYIYLTLYLNARLCHSVFSFVSSRLMQSIWYWLFLSRSDSIFSCSSSSGVTLLFSYGRIYFTAVFKISFFSWCIFNFFLFAGYCLRSLVGRLLAYLEPNSPKTLHSYDEFSGPCMIHVGLDLSFVWSKYMFLLFISLSLILE